MCHIVTICIYIRSISIKNLSITLTNPLREETINEPCRIIGSSEAFCGHAGDDREAGDRKPGGVVSVRVEPLQLNKP